jgi:transglutaminase-like putative cysteine protease
MKRLRIRHIAGFRYPGGANASYNEARMLPVDSRGQVVLTSRLDITPHAVQYSYVDYWGTPVTAFEVLTAHHELTLTASCLVEVTRTLPEVVDLGWEELAGRATSSVRLIEQTKQSPRTAPPAELSELAHGIRDSAQGVHATATRICELVHGSMEYVRGVTGVESTAAEAWAQRRGVCQDMAHVAIGALRCVGIPARYVSGYQHPDAEAEIGQPAVGESHAWVEWYEGEWYGFDPTNGIPVGDRHVLVARGRDYDDVPPIRGVYAGGGASETFVTVEITRES